MIFLDRLWGGDSGGHKEKLSGDLGLSAGWICSYSATSVGGRLRVWQPNSIDISIWHIEQLDFLFACARVFTYMRGLVDIPGQMTVGLRTRKTEQPDYKTRGLVCGTLERTKVVSWAKGGKYNQFCRSQLHYIAALISTIIALHHTTIRC